MTLEELQEMLERLVKFAEGQNERIEKLLQIAKYHEDRLQRLEGWKLQ